MLAHHSQRKHPKYGPLYLTNYQHRVLSAMNAMRLSGEQYVDLSEVKKQIVNALEKRGNVAPLSAYRKETRFRMTALGFEAYALFRPARMYRTDGMCPRCGERPRLDYNGRSTGYCRECLYEIKRDSQRHGNHRSADAPCVKCGATPRHVSSGKVTSYCLPCFKAQNKKNRQARQQRLLEQIAAGNVPNCAAPDCNEPVRHTEKHVSAYCIDHERECNRRSYRKAKDDRWRRKYARLRVVRPAELQQAGD